jgi:8-oxo-dGTP pyrophosphatase MutT (NUDIX family)
LREIKEETGVDNVAGIEFLTAVKSNIRIPIAKKSDVGLILFIYKCSVSGDSKIVLSDEHTEFGWFSTMDSAKKLEYKYPSSFTEKIRIIC